MRYPLLFAAAFLVGTLFMQTVGRADPRTDCADPSPCKILQLTAQEEKILLDERGILATAAQARQLDFAGLVNYFQQKIARAPAGDAVKPAAVVPDAANPNHSTEQQK